MLGKIVFGIPMIVVFVGPMLTFFFTSLPYMILRRASYEWRVRGIERIKKFDLEPEEELNRCHALKIFTEEADRILVELKWIRECYENELEEIKKLPSFAWLFWSCIFWGVIAYLIWGPVS